MDMCTLANLKSISCHDCLEKCFGLLFGFYIFFTTGLKNRPTWMTHMCGWRTLSHNRNIALRHLRVSKKLNLGVLGICHSKWSFSNHVYLSQNKEWSILHLSVQTEFITSCNMINALPAMDMCKMAQLKYISWHTC